MNAARGDVAVMIAGVARTACLTLGALAEIEAGLGCASMAELDARMRALSARDLRIVLSALLRGGGEAPELAEDVSPGVAAKAVAEAFRLGLAD